MPTFLSVFKLIYTSLESEIKFVAKVAGIGFLIGFIIATFTINQPDQLYHLLQYVYKEVLEQIKSFSFLEYFLAIYRQNLTAISIVILLGLLHRFLPLGIIFLNALFAGVVIYALLFVVGSPKEVIYLIPHGILEIPALFVAASLGVSITRRSKGGIKGRIKVLFESRYTIISIALVLLIAAVIESLSIILLQT